VRPGCSVILGAVSYLRRAWHGLGRNGTHDPWRGMTPRPTAMCFEHLFDVASNKESWHCDLGGYRIKWGDQTGSIMRVSCNYPGKRWP
jgi:hypothetical protein